MSEELPFDPYPFIDDPHKQTILSALFSFLAEPPFERKLVKLPDGDCISLEITTPKGWKPSDLSVFLVHGLCGSSKSPYLVRLAKRLNEGGVRAIRYNMRGCGSGRGLAKGIYHSGRSEDVFECLKAIKKEQPESPIVLIGYSLGGNIVLKLVGELGGLAPTLLEKAIAVSPPAELYSSILMISSPENAFYEKYFYRLLRADVHYLQKKFKDLPRIYLPRNLKIYEFDQMYTAPTCGFSSALDYYDKCSSAHVVEDIAIPCKILLAEDDPIVSHHSLDAYRLPKHVKIFKTKKGGHLGYLGRYEGQKGMYWLDNLIFDWISSKE